MKIVKFISWKFALTKKENNHEEKYYETLLKYIKENNIKFSGEEHQHIKEGVPLFDDDTVSLFSFRGWGGIMAQVWGGNYMDFYMKNY